MEIRVHPTFAELLIVWDAVFDDVKKLVTKGLSWDDIEPLAILAAPNLLRLISKKLTFGLLDERTSNA